MERFNRTKTKNIGDQEMKTITEGKLKEQMFMKVLYLHLREEVAERVTKEIDTYCKQEIESACKMQREICAETYFKGTKKKTYL